MWLRHQVTLLLRLLPVLTSQNVVVIRTSTLIMSDDEWAATTGSRDKPRTIWTSPGYFCSCCIHYYSGGEWVKVYTENNLLLVDSNGRPWAGDKLVISIIINSKTDVFFSLRRATSTRKKDFSSIWPTHYGHYTLVARQLDARKLEQNKRNAFRTNS